ncbi:MAG: 50S ribosomal protein L11 methyltransferase [Bryobacteraceae bacterium]
MFSLELSCAPERHDLLVADLWELGCEGIVETGDASLRVFFPDSADRAALEARLGAVARTEDDRDWVAHARGLWQPICAGSKFFLVPDWRDDPTPEGRHRLEITPGQAFGTGVHETTQLCIEALERHVRPGCAVLDVGAGTGILMQVAELLGAERVFGCDNDPIAVEVARGNLRGGGVFLGSVDAVRERSADIVVANINPQVLRELEPLLMAALRSGGIALLSGFAPHEAPAGRLFVKGEWALVERRSPMESRL